ncbi:MAG: hypothetical protein QOG53_3485 [Frankiales bacterium]|jgi:hypothetical protein|nr:hypothetical protein [Frankiales bacterium]
MEAAHWLEVTHEPAGKSLIAGFFRGVLALLVAGSPSLRSRVVVRRRDTHAEVVAFDHEDWDVAALHFDTLQKQLQEMKYLDLCREIGIPFETAVQIQVDRETEPDQ